MSFFKDFSDKLADALQNPPSAEEVQQRSNSGGLMGQLFGMGGQPGAGGQRSDDGSTQGGSVFTMDGQPADGGTGGGDGDGPQGPQRPDRPRKPRKERSPKKRLLLCILITLIFGFVYFWFKLPALNPCAFEFWAFLFWLCVVFAICMIFFKGSGVNMDGHPIKYFKSNVAVPFYIIVGIVVVVLVGTVLGLVILRPHAYAELMPIELDAAFSEDVSEVSWNQIPMLDSDSSNTLANRKLGELSDLVSQFSVSNDSSQINYQGAPVRMNYLNYGNIFKWLNNYRNGIPAYMYVDMRTQEVTVVRLEDGIKYCPSDYLIRDTARYLRFTNPTLMMENINFEIDEDGTPYWIASVLTKRIGLFGGKDVKGALALNAVTGECEYWDLADVPSWVDRVFSADLVVEQYNYYGLYHNGFWNSLFGQNECTETTTGYNYIVQDDDVLLYTGITSVSGDRGNIGFVLVNQRTKEANYYKCAGAEEYSAMSSAEGAVQQYEYTATFPLLLNVDGQPTYFMALKDASSLVKMYAMVNVQQYQIVATGTSLKQTQTNYESLLIQNGIVKEKDTNKTDADTSSGSITGKITEIREADMGGDTMFFFCIDNSTSYFTVNASKYPEAVIVNVGDTVTVTFKSGASGSIIEATSFKVTTSPTS